MGHVTCGNLLRKIGLASAGATLALGVASTGIAGATPTTTTVAAEFDCTSVDVSSSRHDLSNVVLLFDDGSVQRFEGLSGKTGTFAGTGDFAGLELDGVWIKAGNNTSGDGPGYGEFVDAPDDTCGSPETVTGSSSSGSASTDTGSHGSDVVDTDTAVHTDTAANTDTVANTDSVAKADTVVNADTPAAPAAEAAVLGTSVAGQRGAAPAAAPAPAVGSAQVLGVTIERTPAVAAAEANAAPATLAFTGLDLSSLLLASGGLMTSGAVLVRKARRRS